MILPLGTREPLDESERRQWKSWLQTQHSKTKIMVSGPITSWPINRETTETVTDFILLGSKITVEGGWGCEIIRHLLHGRKTMTNLDSILKSRDITFLTKIHVVKGVVFFSSHVWMWVGTQRRLTAKEVMLLNYGAGENSWESLGVQRDQISPS